MWPSTRKTFRKILKQARISEEDFKKLLKGARPSPSSKEMDFYAYLSISYFFILSYKVDLSIPSTDAASFMFP